MSKKRDTIQSGCDDLEASFAKFAASGHHEDPNAIKSRSDEMEASLAEFNAWQPHEEIEEVFILPSELFKPVRRSRVKVVTDAPVNDYPDPPDEPPGYDAPL